MRLRIINSIGGLHLFGNPLGQEEQGFDSRRDFLDLRIDPRDCDELAQALILAVGPEASLKLIALCGQVAHQPQPNPVADFIRSCEDNAGESKRPGESDEAYFARLVEDYPPPE
jgi:hypothetical protein